MEMPSIVSSIISLTTSNESSSNNTNTGSSSLSAASSNNSLTTVNDAPNEYRNLLISLSGQKSNHILWIESWKQCSWKGAIAAEFVFCLDRCGVPYLKNADYQMNLCYDCLDLTNNYQKHKENLKNNKKNPENVEENSQTFIANFKFLWEGNYWHSEISDHAELDMASISTVVNKCANILRIKAFPVKGRPILVYMPNVVQLFVCVLAASRVGAVLTFVNAAIHREAEDLAKIIQLSGADLILTIDGFFSGEVLHSTKKIVDDAIDILHSNMEIHVNTVIVVRHCAANPALPAPTNRANLDVSRRPYYGLEVPYNSERDLHWSDLMLSAEDKCECEWMEVEDILFNTITKNVDGNGVHRWHFESYTVGQIALIVRMLARTFKENCHQHNQNTDLSSLNTTNNNNTNGISDVIWPVVETEDLLFLSSMFAVPLAGASLLMSECAPIHPSPTRIFQIIEKHNVTQLLLAEKYIKLLIRNQQFENVWQQDNDPIWSVSSLQTVFLAAKSRTENEEQIEWMRHTIPNAKIMHLSC